MVDTMCEVLNYTVPTVAMLAVDPERSSYVRSVNRDKLSLQNNERTLSSPLLYHTCDNVKNEYIILINLLLIIYCLSVLAT